MVVGIKRYSIHSVASEKYFLPSVPVDAFSPCQVVNALTKYINLFFLPIPEGKFPFIIAQIELFQEEGGGG